MTGCHNSGLFGQQTEFLAEAILSFLCLILTLLKNIEELKPVKLCLEVRLNLNAIGKRDLLMEGVAVY